MLLNKGNTEAKVANSSGVFCRRGDPHPIESARRVQPAGTGDEDRTAVGKIEQHHDSAETEDRFWALGASLPLFARDHARPTVTALIKTQW
jgi:hypothetical protein